MARTHKRKLVKKAVARIPPSDRRLQMQDIARLAGVSTSTVSRALSHSTLVNKETRTRIAELARSHNYSINIGARNLRLQHSRTVAVVVPYDARTRQHISDPFFVSMLGSLSDALTDQGYDMLLSRVDAERLDLAAELEASGRVIGVILIGQWHHHDQLNQLAVRKVPIVVWGARLPRQIYCTIGSDNITGGLLATQHLIETGRRRIAFFGDPDLPEIGQRCEGYQRALKQNGIPFDTRLVVSAEFSEGSSRRAVDALIRSRITGRPGSGLSTITSGSVRMLVRHARPFFPLMFIASDPHTPSRHERRKLNDGSTALSLFSASSSMRSLPSSSTSSVCMRGFASVSGS